MSIQARKARAKSSTGRIIAIASIVAVAILAIVAVALLNRVPQTASQAPIESSIKVGDVAPNFDVSTTGGPFVLATNGAAKPTLLEVFATWCPHCQREAPVLSKLYDQYKDRANIVGVAGSPLALDESSAETQADVVAWAEKYGATYPIAFDPSLDVAHKYLQGGFPTVVLIDKGKVAAIRSGEMPPKDITNAIDAALAGKTPDPKLGFKG